MRRIAPIAAALVALPLIAHAQALRPRAIGTVVGVDGDTLTVHTIDGKDATVKLLPSTRYSEAKPASVSAIDKNSFLGIAAKDGPDGTIVALQVVIFPEAMRGVGEGHRPWYLIPDPTAGGGAVTTTMTNGTVAAAPPVVTTMTNGTVAATGKTGGAPELTISYKGGEQHVLIDPKTLIVTIAAGSRAELTKGTPVAVTEADNGTDALSVSIGTDGVKPM